MSQRGDERIMNRAARKPVVALIRSPGHYGGVRDALKLIEEEVAKDIKGKRRIFIKPNFVSTSRQLAVTHVDAVRAILDVISKYSPGKIIIGEGPPDGSLTEALSNFGYLKLEEEYDVDFVDLNHDGYVEVEGFDSSLRPLKFRFSKSVVNSDYRISVAKPKTHDAVIVTLSVKNMVVGSLIEHDKSKIHQGTKAINLNIAKIYRAVAPNLSILDGFEGMEGVGPVSGNPVNLRIAAASLHPVSLDAVMSEIMGFNPLDIGYLYYLNIWGIDTADLNQIEVIGFPPDEVARKFEPHPSYQEQLKWR